MTEMWLDHVADKQIYVLSYMYVCVLLTGSSVLTPMIKNKVPTQGHM